MRPLELKIRNFKSYFGAESSFDFRERRLVGIVGPIGSGKSSILDAIAFALYGRTPTVAANTKSLIHQRAGEAAVSLRFEVAGEIWEAVRMLRRKGAGQHALYRYDAADDEPVEKIVLEAEVNARVVALLGLEFDAFSRSVMLAQGRFADFLRARPAERDRVLKGVFGHDRIDAMRDAARARVSTAVVDIEKLTVRVEQHDRLGTEIVDLRVQLTDAEDRAELLKQAKPEMSALDARLAAALRLAADGEENLAELREVEDRFPDPATAQRVVTDAVRAGGVREGQAGVLESLRSQLVAADKRAAEQKEAGEAALLDSASALVAKLEPLRAAVTEAGGRHLRLIARLETQRASVDSAAMAIETASVNAEVAGAAAEVSTGALVAAAAALHEAQHADMAAELRTGLIVGEQCPVCAQSVEDLPASPGAPHLEEAVQTHAAAAATADEAAAARARAGEEHAVAVKAHEAAAHAASGLAEERAAAAHEVETADSGVASVRTELTRLLGDGDADQLLAGRRRVFSDIETVAAAAREAADRARADHDQAILDEQAAEKALGALRIDIADLAARIGAPIDDSDPTPRGVSDRLNRLRAAWEEAVIAAKARRGDAKAEREAATASRTTLLADLAISGDFAAALGELTARADLLRGDIERREAELAEGAGLVLRRDSLVDGKASFDWVATDMTDARFVRYLLDEERRRLATLGSDHFARLSAGRYVFSDDGRFDIVDQTSAEAIRKAESLSGGETFVASLALALSLAEMVARTGGRLDAFFLDEGFGSLDPEHLDLAMDGIEALVTGAGERLVVVVSHVPELRDRVEDLIVLDRDPATGDTRVVRA